MINLPMIFAAQKELDDHILQEQALRSAPVDKRILAFITEVGECANEWKGFKFWKRPENRKPNTMAQRVPAMMPEDQEWYNPLLEEYVDNFHFIVSLGITLNIDPSSVNLKSFEGWKADNLTDQFVLTARKATDLYIHLSKTTWLELFGMFMALGEMLGFDQDQIQIAYFKKNQINHTRQVQGY